MNSEFESDIKALQEKVSKLESGTKDQLSMVVFSGTWIKF